METPHLKEYLVNVVPTILSVKTQDGTARYNSTKELSIFMSELICELKKRIENLEEEQILQMIKEKSPYRKKVKKCLKEKYPPQQILLSIMFNYVQFLLEHTRYGLVINCRA